MTITQQQLENLDKWFDDHGGKPKCPNCGRKNWMINEIVGLPSLEGQKVNLQKLTPVIPLVCEECGSVMMFAAAKPIGLI